jgi:alpha-tubulin suppressor-like RCC1 family protein
MSCDNSNIYNKSCCPDTPYPSVGHESVPSLIDNLVYALYGTITKTVTNGRVVWDIPCDPNQTATLFGVTRNDGEGLMCYIVRALNEGFWRNSAALPIGITGQVLGIVNGNLTWTTGVPATSAVDILGGTGGQILYQQATNNTEFIAVGTAGQILQSNGASAPSWTSLFNGSITGNAGGNAASASVLQTSRSITLAGDVAGTNSFNGSSAITITTTIQPNSVALGTDTTGNYVATIAAGTFGAQSGTSGLNISAAAGEGTTATIALANSGVAAGTYGSTSTVPIVTVDQTGRVTSASSSALIGTSPKVSFFANFDNGGGEPYVNAGAFVDTNNEVRVSGEATSGKLGSGYITSTTYPASLGNGFLTANFPRAGNEQITKLFVSQNNIFILTSAGNIYGAGDNGSGQIGDGTTVDKGIFTKANVPFPVADFYVSNGTTTANHCLAVTTTGALYAWGENANGQLGDGTIVDKLTPTLISGGALTGKTISKCYAFGAQQGYSFVIDTNNDVYATGYNGAGNLGLGDLAQKTAFTQIATRKASAVFASCVPNGSYPNWASTFLLWQGSIWSTGKNDLGQLGIGNVTDQTLFQQIPAITTFSTMSCGGNNLNQGSTMIALLTDGTVRTWGRGTQGQIGNGSSSNVSSPTTPSGLTGVTIVKVQASGGTVNASTGSTMFALSNTGQMYAWGLAGTQIGDGNLNSIATDRNTPRTVRQPPGIAFNDFVAYGSQGNQVVYAKTANGDLWTWGKNSIYQASVPAATSFNIPHKALII